MKNIDKITEAFAGEKDVIIICSKELAIKLNQELADIITKSDQQGIFMDEKKIDLGFNSVFKNGVTLHFTSDFEKLNKSIEKGKVLNPFTWANEEKTEVKLKNPL